MTLHQGIMLQRDSILRVALGRDQSRKAFQRRGFSARLKESWGGGWDWRRAGPGTPRKKKGLWKIQQVVIGKSCTNAVIKRWTCLLAKGHQHLTIPTRVHGQETNWKSQVHVVEDIL